MTPVIARREQSQDSLRRQFEAELLQVGWRLIVPNPRWAEMGDHIFELKNRRILSDEGGCFLYKRKWAKDHRTSHWRRHRGTACYDLKVIEGLFGKEGYQT